MKMWHIICGMLAEGVLRWKLIALVGGALPAGANLPPPPTATDENKSTKTGSAWGGKVADLSKEKGQ